MFAEASAPAVCQRATIFGPVIAGKEVIKGTDAGSVTDRKTAEDSIKRCFTEHAAPLGNGSNLKLQGKQIRAKHARRKPGFGSKDRIALLHNGICKRKVKIPELDNVIPRRFRKRKGIGIKFQEIGYEAAFFRGFVKCFFEKSG